MFVRPKSNDRTPTYISQQKTYFHPFSSTHTRFEIFFSFLSLSKKNAAHLLYTNERIIWNDCSDFPVYNNKKLATKSKDFVVFTLSPSQDQISARKKISLRIHTPLSNWIVEKRYEKVTELILDACFYVKIIFQYIFSSLPPESLHEKWAQKKTDCKRSDYVGNEFYLRARKRAKMSSNEQLNQDEKKLLMIKK